MILVFIQHATAASNLLQSAYRLSQSLKKTLGVFTFSMSENELQTLVDEQQIDADIYVRKGDVACLSDVCNELEASFLFLQLSVNTSNAVQQYLTACRELRIPYLIFKESFSELNIKKVLLPITYLEEEYEKAQFASAFGRFCETETCIYTANDYGSKAALTAGKMQQLFDKFQLNYRQEKAKGDSFKVEKEAIKKAKTENFDIVLLSASREYGLDDIIFGSKERKLVKKSSVPILLVNPRGDLYTLCD